MSLLNPFYALYNRWINFPKPAPGPTWLDDSVNDIKREVNNILEYLSFGSPQLMKKYGGIIRLSRKQYFIAEPEAFKYILKTNAANYSKQNRTYNRLRLIFGRGLIVNEGMDWKNHRALLHPVFDRERLRHYSGIITDHAQKMMVHWQRNPPQSLNIVQTMSALTLKIAFKAFSHYEAKTEEVETVMRLFERGNPHISYFPFLKPWVPSPNNLLFFHAARKLNILLDKIIQERRFKSTMPSSSNPPYQDALSILLHAKETHNLDLSATEILDEYKTLLITGHETIGSGLAWAYYLLAKNPEYRYWMEEELHNVLKGRTPTIDDCPNLPITKAIFLETLRLYPSIWLIPRIARQPDKICGYPIPAKSSVLLNLYALHRNPQYWDNPECFYPQRFLEDAESKRDPFSYLPFSVGPHACIGSNYAVNEGILLLATIGQRFRLELVNNKIYRPEPYVSLKLPTTLKMKVIAI
jgi:cytochrome P450